MYSSKVSVSVHILALTALTPDKPITSDWVAGSIQTNPSLVRRLVSLLKRAGLIQSSTRLGITGLGRPPEKISLLDIFRAVETEQQLFGIHSETNPGCPVGAKIEAILTETYATVQSDFERHLAGVHLSDILNLF